MAFAAKTSKGDAAPTGEALLKRLARTRRVVLVGLGNIGSRLAMELPLAGTKGLLLVDPDRVSHRNLQTCWVFSPDDIGRSKVKVVAQWVRRSFPDVSVQDAECAFDRLGLCRLRDWLPAVLVGAVDSRRARYELAEAALWLGMPLVDLGIPAAGPAAARVQVTWQAVRPIDPLNAWSVQDWNLLEQVNPCGSISQNKGDGPLASSVSGIAATCLGTAAVRKLFAYDASDVGWECRVEVVRFSMARRPLPAKGLSPLDPSDAIRARPPTCRASTLGDLVDFAEKLFGPGAVLLLNREISFGFQCRSCERQLRAGPVEYRPCTTCGENMVPIRPLAQLCRDCLTGHTHESVGCLGVGRDLLRVRGRTERNYGWMEYSEENPCTSGKHIAS